MKKHWKLGAILLSTSMVANADIVTFDTSITGADMAGMQVIATFTDNSTETLLWQTISTDLGNTGNTIVDHEGFAGGVTGNGWGLTQQGFTQGNFDGLGGIFGAWSFIDNSASGIEKLEIRSNNSNVVFDTKSMDELSEDTNGSGQGREFIAYESGAEYTGYSATFQDRLFQELYSDLILELDNPGTSFNFLLDTDKIDENSTETPAVVIVVDDVSGTSSESANQSVNNAGTEGSSIAQKVQAASGSGTNGEVTPSDVEAILQAEIDNNDSPLAKAIIDNDGIKAAIAEDPTLLNELQNFDAKNLPPVSSDPVVEARNEKIIAIAQEIIEDEVKKTWAVEGNGDIDIKLDRVTGEVAIDLGISDEDGDALTFASLIDTPDSPFYLNFDLLFETETGHLDVSIAGVLVATYLAADYFNAGESISLLVDNVDLFGLTDAILQYALYPGSPASAQLANINVSFSQSTAEVPEPSTLIIMLAGLIGLFGSRKLSLKSGK